MRDVNIYDSKNAIKPNPLWNTKSSFNAEFFDIEVYDGLNLTGLRLDDRTERAVLKLMVLNEECMGE
jgi:hypothetical protein